MVDDVTQAALAERQVTATLLAAGVKDITLASPTEWRERLDKMLAGPLEPLLPLTQAEQDKHRLLELLGAA